jgi:serine/threonine protein phosphatase PrpC
VFRPFTIWSEKVKGFGEDAKPIILMSEDNAFGMAAVFDGLGGSGAGRFELSRGSVSGAQLAATLARETMVDVVHRIWLTSTAHDDYRSKWNLADPAAPPQPEAEHSPPLTSYENPNVGVATANTLTPVRQDPTALPDSCGFCFTVSSVPNPPISAFSGAVLAHSFDSEFTKAINRLAGQVSGSRLKSRIKRFLPTTIAGVFFSENLGKISVRVVWAGDSRVYFLGNRGLFQLSIDHAQVASTASFDTSGDAPLTRVISENTPNEVAEYFLPAIAEPGFLVACTDGAYGYFPTAVHFELALWSALQKQTPSEQAEALAKAIEEVTQDDASLAIVPIGFDRAGTLAVDQRRSNLCAIHDEFESTVALLRETKLQATNLDAKIEHLRGVMKPLLRSLLSGE